MRRIVLAAIIIFCTPLAMSIVIDGASLVTAGLQGQPERVDRADRPGGQPAGDGEVTGPGEVELHTEPWYLNPMWWIIGAAILLVFVVMAVAVARAGGPREGEHQPT